MAIPALSHLRWARENTEDNPCVAHRPLAAPAAAVAQTEITSAIEFVMVYPDGATVTRRIRVDLPQGDSVLRAMDFPPTLDPASLRVEGEARAKLTIGGIDARPPRAERPPADPALDDRILSL